MDWLVGREGNNSMQHSCCRLFQQKPHPPLVPVVGCLPVVSVRLSLRLSLPPSAHGAAWRGAAG